MACYLLLLQKTLLEKRSRLLIELKQTKDIDRILQLKEDILCLLMTEAMYDSV